MPRVFGSRLWRGEGDHTVHPDNFKYNFKYTFFIANIQAAYDWAAYLKGHFDELLGLLINFTHNKGLI